MDTAPRRGSSYLISVWVDRPDDSRPVWCGALVTAAEQGFCFSTLAELNRWLCELAGWQDPPVQPPTKEASGTRV
jgi:hypothetical protein